MTENGTVLIDTKRKQRGSYNSSGSDTPDFKRVRNQSGSVSEVEDEVIEALNMAERLGGQLDHILEKLEKLDAIDSKLTAIDNRMSTMELNINELTTRQGQCDKLTRDALESIKFLNSDLEDHKKNNEESHRRLEGNFSSLQKEMLYLSCYSRRENLVFFGLEEKRDEDVQERIYAFMEHNLGIPNADTIEFQQIHRLGRPRSSSRPIIARFLRYPEREKVRKAAFKLKGTHFRIMEDFPREIIERRRKLLPLLQQAKAENKRATFSKAFPDRLIIEGQFVSG